jgi:LysR family glycine cleavage system transcriptional activator
MIRLNDWHQWLSAAGADRVDSESGLRFENSGLVYQALSEGLGVAVGQFAFVADDIAAGRIVAPFTAAVQNDTGYYLLYPEARIKNRNVADFREWITQEARKSSRGALRHLAAIRNL